MNLETADIHCVGGGLGGVVPYRPDLAQTPKRSLSGIPVVAECETVFLGASAYGARAAFKNPAKTVVLEQSLMLVPEFSGALLPNVLTAAEGEIATLVRERIEKEGLSGNGRYHAPPVSDVMSALVMHRKANLFLNANVADIRRAGRDSPWRSSGRTVIPALPRSA